MLVLCRCSERSTAHNQTKNEGLESAAASSVTAETTAATCAYQLPVVNMEIRGKCSDCCRDEHPCRSDMSRKQQSRTEGNGNRTTVFKCYTIHPIMCCATARRCLQAVANSYWWKFPDHAGRTGSYWNCQGKQLKIITLCVWIGDAPWNLWKRSFLLPFFF
jgi:hypothetical protein